MVFTKEGYEIVNSEGIFRPLLESLFTAPWEDKFKNGIASEAKKSKKKHTGCYFSKIGEKKHFQQKRFQTAVTNLKNCKTPTRPEARLILEKIEHHMRKK